MTTFELAEKLLALPREERKRREELWEAFAMLVVEKPIAALRHAKEELEQQPTVEAPSSTTDGDDRYFDSEVVSLWTRNLLRVFEDRARLIQGSLPADTVAAGLGVSPERLHQLAQAGMLVEVETADPKYRLYPSWQFTPRGQIVKGLEAVKAAAREAEMDTETLHFFMVEPNDRLDGNTPASRLAEGDSLVVARILRSAGLGAF